MILLCFIIAVGELLENRKISRRGGQKAEEKFRGRTEDRNLARSVISESKIMRFRKGLISDSLYLCLPCAYTTFLHQDEHFVGNSTSLF
jgi:hypothetical protein